LREKRACERVGAVSGLLDLVVVLALILGIYGYGFWAGKRSAERDAERRRMNEEGQQL
jgi:hypothetical protein